MNITQDMTDELVRIATEDDREMWVKETRRDLDACLALGISREATNAYAGVGITLYYYRKDIEGIDKGQVDWKTFTSKVIRLISYYSIEGQDAKKLAERMLWEELGLDVPQGDLPIETFTELQIEMLSVDKLRWFSLFSDVVENTFDGEVTFEDATEMMTEMVNDFYGDRLDALGEKKNLYISKVILEIVGKLAEDVLKSVE